MTITEQEVKEVLDREYAASGRCLNDIAIARDLTALCNRKLRWAWLWPWNWRKTERCGIALDVITSTNVDIPPTVRDAENFGAPLLPDLEWKQLSKESREKVKKWFDLACKYLQKILDELQPLNPNEPSTLWLRMTGRKTWEECDEGTFGAVEFRR